MSSFEQNERLALWLAPLAAVVPLIPFFSMPGSPWFLGKLMGEAGHPMSMPGWGPWISAAGVVFDGAILSYALTFAVILPVYFLLKDDGRMSSLRTVILFCVAAVLASQAVHVLQNFRQPGLREFATGWMSPVFGCVCGLSGGLCFTFLRKRRIPGFVAYSLPAVLLVACGMVLVQAARLVNR
jgi:hypothetical protein